MRYRRSMWPDLFADLWVVTYFLVATTTLSAADRPIDFSHDVVPILKAHCAKCHTNGTYKGSLSLDTRESLLKSESVVPGRSAESELFRRITSLDPDERMPSAGDTLKPRDIAVLKSWIDEGLHWETGFTFKSAAHVAPLRPRRIDLPPSQTDWNHPIDRIVMAYWERTGTHPPDPVDDRTFARRVSLDVIGLLPAVGELETFLRDERSDKRTRYVQELLANRRGYADHWMSFWNDLLRNEYRGTGYIDGGRKQISQWLYSSLLDNKPYDQFVRELIDPSPESAGFIQGIKWRGRVNASQVAPIQFSQNVSQVFFGINLKCASCHDSFIDSWKLDDAYGLAAVVAEEPLEIHRCDKATGAMASARFLWPELGAIDPMAPREQRLKQLAALMTHSENGRFARTIANRFWQRLMGRGIVHPVDVMSNPPWSADLLDELANYLTDHQYDLQQLLVYIVSSRTYQSRVASLAAEVPNDEFVFRGPQLRRLSAEQFVDAIWQMTGTAPAKAAAPMKLPEFGPRVPQELTFIRASLVHCDPLMRSLGRPNREQVVTTRGDMLTTLQALDLSNGAEMADMLSRGAQRLLRDFQTAEKDPRELVDQLFLRALCRLPTMEERTLAMSLVGAPASAEGVEDLLWAISMLPEFQLIH